MSRDRRSGSLILALAVGALALACDDAALTDPGTEVLAPPSLSASRAADVDRRTFTVPFPPNPAVDFAPVPAPCLELDQPLRMSGAWTGWTQTVQLSPGRLHLTEYIDYSGIMLATAAGDRTWTPGPGASETIVANVPVSGDDVGDAAFNVRHEFHVRFVSGDGGPDLRIEHRVRQLLGPDGELRKNEFEPFTAECIGGGE